MDPNELGEYSDDLVRRLGPGSSSDLASIMSGDVLDNDLYMDNEESVCNEPDDVIIVHMDIREQLRTLRKLVEQKIGVDLVGYQFWLQDAQELEPHKNLVDQCVKGEGLVQINVQIQTINQRINIIDVLKPTEEALAALAAIENDTKLPNDHRAESDSEEVELANSNERRDYVDRPSPVLDSAQTAKPCINWTPDHKFRKEQLRLKIPEDPMLWEVTHVRHWFEWAVREFNLSDFRLADWSITGEELCSLTHEEFREKMPHDPGNIFYTHLQLLKECKSVSVVDRERENSMSVENDSFVDAESLSQMDEDYKIMRKSHFQKAKALSLNNLGQDESIPGSYIITANGSLGSGNNGQIQLWQFLLDLLTDRQHKKIIQWVGEEGEFKLTDPEKVARLWGVKKNKPAMNYEKLSRALRYYYDGDMISKVSGKRFAYKFDCDLKLLIGYDAGELAALVNENPNGWTADTYGGDDMADFNATVDREDNDNDHDIENDNFNEQDNDNDIDDDNDNDNDDDDDQENEHRSGNANGIGHGNE